MERKHKGWPVSPVKFAELDSGEIIGAAMGWVYVRPRSQETLVAATLDILGDHGPIVFETGERDILECMTRRRRYDPERGEAI